MLFIIACKKDKQQKTDVYTVGYRKIDDGEFYATLWKNNEETRLTPLIQSARATCITIENDDIYIGGYTLNTSDDEIVAKYWKNGIETSLTDGTYLAVVNSIAVSNGDVYMRKNIKKCNSKAIYWKNGVINNLNKMILSVEVNDINIHNGNVYCVGYKVNGSDVQEARLWINNTSTTLAENASAYSILINGNDIYVAGQALFNDVPTADWKEMEYRLF
ncbi:MAG: hypothetical protein IPL21_03115 [Saprospirales bacterium]|nr:hypothetical protein [Saprospirales bacterium]